MTLIPRREVLRAGTAAVLTAIGWRPVGAALIESLSKADVFQDAQFGEVVPFEDRKRESNPREVAYGSGLDGRYRRDLSRLTQDTLVTPNEQFFIRTRCPDLIDFSKPWTITLKGEVKEPVAVLSSELSSRAVSMGPHLIECAGSGHGGLISAAKWSGVPIGTVLDRAQPTAKAKRILVSGFDQHSKYNSGYDERGANWIFTRAQLEESGAFLATHMNGRPLRKDHGYPVRLVVPGWYGCTCIKWVDAIRFVGESTNSTNHMRDFAGRTHQKGSPKSARDFEPATIDLTASPVRVEKWRHKGAAMYRVIGILWGGQRTTDQLQIRFNDDEKFVPVDCYDHVNPRTWTLWTHAWRPSRPGKYVIRLRVADSTIRTRRLDSGYYRRSIVISDV